MPLNAGQGYVRPLITTDHNVLVPSGEGRKKHGLPGVDIRTAYLEKVVSCIWRKVYLCCGRDQFLRKQNRIAATELLQSFRLVLSRKLEPQLREYCEILEAAAERLGELIQQQVLAEFPGRITVEQVQQRYPWKPWMVRACSRFSSLRSCRSVLAKNLSLMTFSALVWDRPYPSAILARIQSSLALA